MMSKKVKTTVFFFSFLIALAVGNYLCASQSAALSVLSSEVLCEPQIEQSEFLFKKTTDKLSITGCKDAIVKQQDTPMKDDKQPRLRMKSFSGMSFQAASGGFCVGYQSYINSFHPFKIVSRFIYCLLEKLLI